MKFTERPLGDAAEASAHTGGTLRDTLQLCAVVVACGVVLYFTAALAVDKIVENISPETEARIFAKLPLGNLLPSGSEEEAARWKPLLERMAAHPEVPKLPYTLEVAAEPDMPNAFAVPGGRIVMTRALLDKLGDDETAVAFVIGHELGHFRQRDHLRGLGRGVALAVCLMALSGSEDLFSVAQAAADAMNRTYSRAQEEGADRFGARLVLETFGSAEGADKLFKLLRDMEGLPNWAYMLTTHPDPDRRIRAIRETVEARENR